MYFQSPGRDGYAQDKCFVVGLGTQIRGGEFKTAVDNNPLAPAKKELHLGAGANFELLWFSAIKAGENDRSTLLGGGLNVDLICGWEFMRASAVQFFLQAEVNPVTLQAGFGVGF